MLSEAATVEEYIANLPEERRRPVNGLRTVITKNLPTGFEEVMGYGMISYVVPHKLYPAGYHCDPKQPLPFASLASQKNGISFYHMGVYSDPALLKWFTEKYDDEGVGKPDMGKSCIRFKKMDKIPLSLIGELCTKMSVHDWIMAYEKMLRK